VHINIKKIGRSLYLNNHVFIILIFYTLKNLSKNALNDLKISPVS
jgi:hypothetical protein